MSLRLESHQLCRNLCPLSVASVSERQNYLLEQSHAVMGMIVFVQNNAELMLLCEPVHYCAKGKNHVCAKRQDELFGFMK